VIIFIADVIERFGKPGLDKVEGYKKNLIK
jgi:hypothetical protein